MLIGNSAQGPQSQVEVCHHAPPTRRPLPDAVAALPYSKSVLQPVCLGPGLPQRLSLPVTGRGFNQVGDLQPKKGSNQQPEEGELAD